MDLEDFFLPAKSISLKLNSFIPNGYVSIAEATIGIIAGSFPNLISLLLPGNLADVTKKFISTNISTHGIFVCGLIPGSSAYSCGKIFLGDQIMSINDSPVFMESLENNIRSACRQENGQIRIVIRSLRIDKLTASVGKSVVSDFVVSFGENNHWNNLCNSLSLFPFAVFCCGLSTSDEISKKYSHPLSDHRIQEALDGMIPCLSMLTDEYTKRSYLNALQILLEKERISVAVSSADNVGYLVLALPSRVSDVESCRKALQILTRVILFYFGSFERAFESSDGWRIQEIDKIVSVILFEILCPDLLFEELQMSTDMTWPIFQIRFNELPHLPLPETVKVSVDSLLTDFEASDFSDPFLIPPRRRFVIMGSSLFYKGFLVGSHLNTSDLVDIGLFLRHRFILSALSFSPQMASTLCGSLLGGPSAPELAFSPRGEQSVIWCEVFPTHRSRNGSMDEEPCWPSFGYSEPAGARYILLVVPKKQTFVAVLLEASGMSATNLDTELNADSVIVREVSKLLTRLDGIGLLAFCEQGLSSSLGVKLVSADAAFPSASLFIRSGHRRSRSGGIVLQTLAVQNAKRFSSALKGFLRTQKSISMSFSSDQPQNFDSEMDANDDENMGKSNFKRGFAFVSKLGRWLGRHKMGRSNSELSRVSSICDIDRPESQQQKDFDAFHYIESRRGTGGKGNNNITAAANTGARERAGVPGSYAGSGGTMSTSEGPGRDEGIPLPLANALPTLFDMSEAHLHSGDVSSSANHGANRGNMGSPMAGAPQDILFSCPGCSFSFLFLDRNQGYYVCPNDTFTPPGSSMFHRRVSESFIRSTVTSIDMLDKEEDLEEAIFIYPTDPVEWFDYDPSLLIQTTEMRNNGGKVCSSVPCSPKQMKPSNANDDMNESSSSLFTVNPASPLNPSYWCTIRKFPKQEREEEKAGAKSQHQQQPNRMFALCGDDIAVGSALDLGLQFAFDMAL